MRWITESEVCDLIDLVDAIGVVRRALGVPRENWTMGKAHATWDGVNTLHALGGGLGARGIVGTKTWAHTGHGATPLVVLWDANDGRLLAVIEAFALGQLRTAAMSGVATDALARTDACVAAIIGTGKQAFAQLAALAAVRELRAVRVWSPTPEHCQRFAERVAELELAEVHVAEDVAEAAAGAQLITTVTRARQPFLHPDHVCAEAHVNAIGAITPERCEVGAELVARCDPIVADDPGAARELATELAGASSVLALRDVLANPELATRRAAPSLFKAVGVGLADVALSAELFDRAVASGIGRQLPEPRRHVPRLVTPTNEVTRSRA